MLKIIKQLRCIHKFEIYSSERIPSPPLRYTWYGKEYNMDDVYICKKCGCKKHYYYIVSFGDHMGIKYFN